MNRRAACTVAFLLVLCLSACMLTAQRARESGRGRVTSSFLGDVWFADDSGLFLCRNGNQPEPVLSQSGITALYAEADGVYAALSADIWPELIFVDPCGRIERRWVLSSLEEPVTALCVMQRESALLEPGNGARLCILDLLSGSVRPLPEQSSLAEPDPGPLPACGGAADRPHHTEPPK